MTTKTISQITSFSKATLKRVLLLTAMMSFFASYTFAQGFCLNDTLNQHPQFYNFGTTSNSDAVVVNGLTQFGWTGSSNVTNSTFIGNGSYSTFNYNGALQTLIQPINGVNPMGFNGFTNTTELHIMLRSFNDEDISNAPATLTIKYAGITIVTFTNPTDSATGNVGTYKTTYFSDSASSNFEIYPAGSESSAPFRSYTAYLPLNAPSSGNLEIEFNGGSGSGVITDDFQVQEILVRTCGYEYSGAVYLDNNGMTDGAINGTGISTADGNQLRIGMVNSAGQVVDSTDVRTDGSFYFVNGQMGDFTLRLLNLPATYINTGEKLSSESPSDGTPNGITTSFTVGGTLGNTGQNDVIFGIQPNAALPVIFGNISASFDGSQLLVNWNSIAEINNDHYEVEVSRDGATFTSLGTVASKAENGNSSTAIDYNFTKSQSEAGSALGWLVLPIPFLLLAFTRRNRRTLALGVLVSVISLAGVSCNKSTDTLSDTQGKLYVRIAQVDKDGTKSYSKTIQVVRK